MSITAYAYRLKRPVQLGAQPRDFLCVPGSSNTTREGGDYGRIFYERRLTRDEVKSFELVRDGSEILEPVMIYPDNKVYEWKIAPKPQPRPVGRPTLPDSERKSVRWAKRITQDEKDWLEHKLKERRNQIS